MILKITNSKKTNFQMYEIARLQQQVLDKNISSLTIQESFNKFEDSFKKIEKTLGINESNYKAKSMSDDNLDIANTNLYDSAKKELKTLATISAATLSDANFQNHQLKSLIISKLNLSDIPDKDKLIEAVKKDQYVDFALTSHQTELEIENMFPVIFYGHNADDLEIAHFHKIQTDAFVSENRENLESLYESSLARSPREQAQEMSL